MNLLPYKILKILLASCLATPLLAFSNVIFPYTVPKIFAFRVLVEIAAVFFIYLVLKCPKIFCHSGRPFVIPASSVILASSVIPAQVMDPDARRAGIQNPGSRIKSGMTISVAVLIFLLIFFLSALFGTDFYTSFWGNLERGMGLFGLLHFVVWFLMLVSVFNADRAGKEIKENKVARSRGGEAPLRDSFLYQLIKVSVFTSALTSLLAIFQHFFSLSDLLPQADRVYSLIGNAGVLGSYSIFNIFLAGYLAISSFRESNFGHWNLGFFWKFVIGHLNFFGYCFLFLVSCWALALTGTRGAWLGLLAGIIVFSILSFFIPPSSVIPAQVMDPDARRAGIQNPGSRIKSGMTNKKKLVVFLFLILIFILITSLFSIRNSLFVKNNPTLSRLTSISLSDSTVQSRLILWQDAWRAWQARPWLGFGPENFEAAIGPYLSPKLIGFEAYAFDRAHSFIFDYGLASGWLGLVGYLVLFCAALWALWQRRADNFMFFAVFTALLTAYLVQNLFIFDSFISYLMLFFVLALINNSNQGLFFSVIPAKAGIQDYGSRIHRYSGADKCEMTTKLSVVKNLLLIFVIGNLSFVIYSYNLKPLLSANYANQILSLPASDAAQAAVLLKDALALNSFASPEIAYQAAIDYTEKINQNSVLTQNEEFYNIAADELARVIGRSPNQPRSYIALAWLDLYFSGRHSERINEAIDLGNKIIKLSPIKKDAYLILVAGDALSNQPQKAEEIISQASAIDVKMGKEVRAYLERLK